MADKSGQDKRKVIKNIYPVSNTPEATTRPAKRQLEGVVEKKLVSDNLFDETFPGPQYELNRIEGEYVGTAITPELLTTEVFRLWSPNHNDNLPRHEYPVPVLISAQTGKGKNYFVTHTLREYAKENGQRILYVCNRVALNYQMKKDLADLIGKRLGRKAWEQTQEFGNITVISYQSLATLLRSSDNEIPSVFHYVVLDECHYFYSDAYFNTFTGETLKQIPEVFQSSFRIYMTATPDCVLAPIYGAEMRAIKRREKEELRSILSEHMKLVPDPDLDVFDPVIRSIWAADINAARYVAGKNRSWYENLNQLPKIKMYELSRDFSIYGKKHFFTRRDTSYKDSKKSKDNVGIISKDNDALFCEIVDSLMMDDIGKERTDNKWIVFVARKEYGRALALALEAEGIDAQYFDRGSADSDDDEEAIRWNNLLKRGTLGNYSVLITTSVLDNGFSIKDPTVHNIALFSEDKTEFLQQLGRIRLDEGQAINLYIAKMTIDNALNKQRNRERKEILELYYGKEAEKNPRKGTDVANKIATLPQERRPGYVAFLPAKGQPRGTQVLMNHMAYYRALLTDNEIQVYDALVKENSEKAPILYKLRWLSEYPDSVTFDNMVYEDIDVNLLKRWAEELERFLDGFIAEPIRATNTDCYKNLHKGIKDRYYQVRKRIRNMEAWDNPSRQRGVKSLNGRLRVLQQSLSEHMSYWYDLEGEGGAIKLVRENK